MNVYPLPPPLPPFLSCRSGRLLPGGEPDFHSVSVNIINDYQRGKLPYFVAPPLAEGETPKSVAAEPTVKASFDNHIKAAAAVDAAGSRGDGEEREREMPAFSFIRYQEGCWDITPKLMFFERVNM